MKLLKKYADELAHLNSPALIPLLKDIEVIEIGTENPVTVDPKKTIFVGNNAPIADVVAAFKKYNIEHFVQTDNKGFIYDLFAASIMLKKPDAFIKNPLPFFMNHFKPDEDGTDNVRSTTLTFGSSEEKSPLLFQITSFLEENPKTANFIEAVHMIADELIMNALYNAPVTSQGEPVFMSIDRAEQVELPEGKKAKIFITHDQRRLLIGCEDPYGSVNRFKIMNQLTKVFKPGSKPAPNENSAGAGLGCKMMIDHSCGYHMVVRRNKQTLVCCALPLGVSYMKAERMSKNLHMVFFQ